MRSTILLTLALLLGATVTLVPKRAEASGFYLTERGMRTLGRGGAFVAGAEGVESLWINPAGLGRSGNTFHMEGNQTFLRGSFQRVYDPSVGQDVGFHEDYVLGAINGPRYGAHTIIRLDHDLSRTYAGPESGGRSA